MRGALSSWGIGKKMLVMSVLIIMVYPIISFSTQCILRGFSTTSYWIISPSIAAFFMFISFLLKREERYSDLSWRLFLRTLKDKSLIIVFTCLLIAYAVLYFVVPLYVMGYVNKENREGLQSLVSGIVEDSVNGTERVRKIYEWMTNSTHLTNVYRSCSIDNYIVFIPKPPFICLRLVGEEYPLWFLSSRCGACMEYSLLFREMANAANLTVRSVHNPGEDHNWDEVLINGEWIIVDAGWPILNPSSSFYEVGRGLNVSYVYGMYPNGTLVDLTERYTNTGQLKILVVDVNNKPIKNAGIEFYSFNLNNQERKIHHLDCVTDENGYCNVRLGGGKYKVKAIIMHGLIGYANESMFELVEGQTREVIIVIREELRFLKLSPILESFLQEAVSAVCGFMYLYLFSIILIMTRYYAELLSA
jgi:hypothetical protein